MSKKLLAGLIATVVLAGAVPAQAAAPPGSQPGTLQPALDAIVAAGMPGVFAQARDGKKTESAASGLANVTTGQPTRPGMQHRVGSITKTFTATALLQLVGEGKLELDAPYGRYLPDLAADGVTVRMLLNHTSGIGDYDTVIFNSAESLEANRNRTFGHRELASIGLAAPRTNAPGVSWSYSNTNYVLAGLILEKITRQPAWLAISSRIIWPLGLWQTYFPGTTTRILGPHSQGYIPWYEGELRDFSGYNMSWAWTAGELVATTADLNTFYRALLTGKLLKPAQLAQMQTVFPYDPAQPQYGGYGLGLYSTYLPCGLVWGHDGLVWGHSAISWHTPDASRQVTVASNMTHYVLPGDPDPIFNATINMLIDKLCGPATPSTQRADSNAPRPHLIDTLPRP